MFTKLYQSMKTSLGKMDFSEIKFTERYQSMKTSLGKMDFSDATKRVVGPFGFCVGAYKMVTDASNDLLEVAKDERSHVEEIRKLLDPEGFGQVQEKPEPPTRVRHVLSLLQEGKNAGKKAGSRAIPFMKRTEISSNESSEMVFSSF